MVSKINFRNSAYIYVFHSNLGFRDYQLCCSEYLFFCHCFWEVSGGVSVDDNELCEAEAELLY